MENKDWREEAREEWHVRTFNIANEVSDYSKVEMLIADWWIEKIESLLKSKQEEILSLVYDKMILHTPLKVEQTRGTEFDKGYIYYQDMVVAGFELVEDDLKPIISNILK